jgi:hypothetical protein
MVKGNRCITKASIPFIKVQDLILVTISKENIPTEHGYVFGC